MYLKLILFFTLGYYSQKCFLPIYKKNNYSLDNVFFKATQILTALIFCLLYLNIGFNIKFCYYSLISSILISMSFIDSKYMEIADETNCLILLLGIFNLIFNIPNISTYFEGFLIGGGIYLFIAVLSNGSIGGGDIKLMGALGLCLGLKPTIFILFLSSVLSFIGLVFAVVIRKQSLNSFIPYGPYIAISTIISMMYL